MGYRVPESEGYRSNDREPGAQKRTDAVEDDPRKSQQTKGRLPLNAFDDTGRCRETCRLLKSGRRSIEDSAGSIMEHERVER